MKHSFKFGLFGKNVRMFSQGNMGVVIEKEADVVCVYGTNSANTKILCAVPLCHPKLLKGERYTVQFNMKECAMIRVRDIAILIDFKNHTCSTNIVDLHCYGSDEWGQNVQVDWR